MLYVEINTPGYKGAFALDDNTGELLEAVEYGADGPDFANDAGICDERGEDPTLQAKLRDLLTHMAAAEQATA